MCRQAVLGILLKLPFALARAEIEQQLARVSDRIALKRTLRTLEAKGLIHRVIDHSDILRYAACVDASVPAVSHHIHLKCTACQYINCLSQVAVPAVVLPASYRVVCGYCLLVGLCERCQPECKPETVLKQPNQS